MDNVTFDLIDEPGVYGYTATAGGYTVEVLRSYAHDWFVYAHVDSARYNTNNQSVAMFAIFDAYDIGDIYRMSGSNLEYSEAIKRARQIVRGLRQRERVLAEM